MIESLIAYRLKQDVDLVSMLPGGIHFQTIPTNQKRSGAHLLIEGPVDHEPAYAGLMAITVFDVEIRRAESNATARLIASRLVKVMNGIERETLQPPGSPVKLDVDKILCVDGGVQSERSHGDPSPQKYLRWTFKATHREEEWL